MKLVVTNAGRDALKNAAGNGTNALMIESVVLGNGRYTPDAGQAWIREEHHRLKTIAGTVTGSRSLHVTVRDESRDRYSVFEIGLVTSTGVLFAVYSQNDVIIEKASGSTLLLSLDIELTDIDVKQIAFGDTSFINPAATTEMQGVVELATDDEARAAEDGRRAITPRVMGHVLDERFAKLGSASSKDVNAFDEAGAASNVKKQLSEELGRRIDGVDEKAKDGKEKAEDAQKRVGGQEYLLSGTNDRRFVYLGDPTGEGVLLKMEGGWLSFIQNHDVKMELTPDKLLRYVHINYDQVRDVPEAGVNRAGIVKMDKSAHVKDVSSDVIAASQQQARQAYDLADNGKRAADEAWKKGADAQKRVGFQEYLLSGSDNRNFVYLGDPTGEGALLKMEAGWLSFIQAHDVKMELTTDGKLNFVSIGFDQLRDVPVLKEKNGVGLVHMNGEQSIADANGKDYAASQYQARQGYDRAGEALAAIDAMRPDVARSKSLMRASDDLKYMYIGSEDKNKGWYTAFEVGYVNIYYNGERKFQLAIDKKIHDATIAVEQVTGRAEWGDNWFLDKQSGKLWQWGKVSSGSSREAVVWFPRAFRDNDYSIVGMDVGTGGGWHNSRDPQTWGVTLRKNGGNNDIAGQWIAFGNA